MRLNVDMFAAEDLFGAFARDVFGNINELATAIVTLRRITFGVLVRKHRPHRFEHGFRYEILRSDHLKIVSQTALLVGDGRSDFRVYFR